MRLAWHKVPTHPVLKLSELKRALSLKKALLSEDFVSLVEALHENRKLWSILATDVMSEGNRLPDELKANIIYLQKFVEIHSQRVLQKKQNAKVLIEVNAAILGGIKDAI